jgi:uncharacterized protein YndB with AHSA1/START domain
MNTLTATDREIIITRTVKAPRALVFKAWTDPAHIDRWFGPNGFTNKTLSMDLKVGGQWKYTMTGPDGTVFPNLVVYKEIFPVERLVYDHGDWENPKHFEATITFEETDGGTLITMRSIFPTKEARDLVVEKYGAIEGGRQTLARLEEYLSAR